MIERKYTGAVDLKLLQDFNAEAISLTNHCGYLHPGDIPHHIYNGNKHYNPFDLITIWEDEQGIAAWLLSDPSFKCFDAQVRPDLRGNDFEQDVLAMAYDRTRHLMKKYGVDSDYLHADAFQEDTARAELLTSIGFEPDNELPYVLNRMEIKSVEVPVLPDGFSLRSAKGIADAAALADVHNGAFNPTNWTPDLYRKVMESPGYSPERELVIQGPDDKFVAFAVTWHDPLNKIGLFEPVGTVREFQRRGFGQAIMYYGLQQMAAAGMNFATVAHFGDNEAARGLYQSCGFRPWYLLDSYRKRL